LDEQVKVRGYRIELGEIESVLAGHPLVRQAAVVAQSLHGQKQLVAYLVVEGELDREHVLAFLKERLPDYLVPAFVIALEQLPLTNNGKLDKRALPPVEAGALLTHTYQPPQGELEEKLALIWQQLLGVEKVGRNDNFFLLGGHSLLATRVVSAIQQEFETKISIRIIFQLTSIAELAEYLSSIITDRTFEDQVEFEVFEL
jgi:acyl carrier protein